MAIGGGHPDTLITRLVAEDKVPWYKKRNLRLLYILMFPTCIGIEMTSGFDSSMINGLQAVPTWDALQQSTLHYSWLAICLILTGIDMLSAIRPFRHRQIRSAMGDYLRQHHHDHRRHPASCISGLRDVCDRTLPPRLRHPFAIVAASSMIGELAYPKERARMGSLFNASWFIGAIVAAGVTLGTFTMPNNWGWRIPSVLQVIPSLLQITFIWFLPESPRWLISKGRGEEAYTVLAKYHAEGDLNSEFVKLEFAEIEKTLELERENSNTSWRQLVSTPGMRKRILICSFLGLATQWSGNGLTSYFLARILDNVGIHDDRTKNLINLAMTCWGFVNGTTLALTISKIPRRAAYLTCTISLVLIFTGWTIASARYALDNSQAASRAVIAFIFLYSPAYNIGYNALTYTYLVELFPYHARAKGISVFQWWGRAAGFFNQFVNPIGIANAGWKYYISYCVFLLFEVVFVYFLFPETSNRTLEELAFLFEGEKMRKEQQKRIEEEMQDGQLPVTPKSDEDKESALHFEDSKK
ncbi:Lactose permease [Grifola frondosa]|uniref:Lactose permease n=1 Tax=Grifola frondosa TaxID=5627 RepID=A0A1C7M1E6_GRIFR|nr:Lactose permease [Grifola frondosa]